LPKEVAAIMLMPVHDELVFGVPVNDVDQVRRSEKTMIRAAEEVLGGQIRSKLKP
jgi:DNA polymerase I-like protein with 3'-5' exonuclease and polymerase domains